jgi:TatD DNase family protein
VALRWIDNHCHLGWEGDEPPTEEAIDRMVADAQAAGVERFVTVGTDVPRSAAAVAAAGRHPGVVWATVGLHPHDAKLGLDGLAEMLAAPGVVAVGECGLDYHYEHSPRATQREAFAAQIGWAHERDLALMVHTREAWEDTFAVLDAEGVPERTVFHCFTGGPDEAQRALDLGCYLSFSGIVSFKNANDLRAAARLVPADRLLVETDAPYLAPEPYRGKPNEPAFVVAVGTALAAARDEAVDLVAETTRTNAATVFAS